MFIFPLKSPNALFGGSAYIFYKSLVFLNDFPLNKVRVSFIALLLFKFFSPSNYEVSIKHTPESILD